MWNHAKAVNMDDLSQDDARSVIAANCQYLEDRWKITINPILVCYKNEYSRNVNGPLIQPDNSTWTYNYDKSQKLPNFAIYNSPIPDSIKAKGTIEFFASNTVFLLFPTSTNIVFLATCILYL